MVQVDVPTTADGKYTIHYANFAGDKVTLLRDSVSTHRQSKKELRR